MELLRTLFYPTFDVLIMSERRRSSFWRWGSPL